MTEPTLIGVLDYEMGNLRSVAKSLEAAGATVKVSSSERELNKADILVLPGQGAFDTAMRVLKQKKLDRFVKEWLSSGRPYLGICLGLQLLFESSEEAPGEKGLGILPGRVRKFRPKSKALKVPHMGWNQVDWSGEMRGQRRDSFYFVHSYYADPADDKAIAGKTDYAVRFCSAVARGNLIATQFHPEKSGDAGQRFLRDALRALKPLRVAA